MSNKEFLETIRINDTPEFHKPGYYITDYRINRVAAGREDRRSVSDTMSEFQISQYSHTRPVTIEEGIVCDVVVGDDYFGNGVLLTLDKEDNFHAYQYHGGGGEYGIRHRPGDTYVYFALKRGLRVFSLVSPSLSDLKEKDAVLIPEEEAKKQYQDGNRSGYVRFCKSYYDYLNYVASEEIQYRKTLGHGR